ncbi:MAG: hypothetical protein JJ899_08650, partial [Alphaproteobacteria bacterium]|nr:hypothetical protein [Alphaproteobacteria bacterium]
MFKPTAPRIAAAVAALAVVGGIGYAAHMVTDTENVRSFAEKRLAQVTGQPVSISGDI